MANTIVEVPLGITGETLTLFLYQADALVNGAGDAMTERTNDLGSYTATVTEAVTGLCRLTCKRADGTILYKGFVDMLDDTETHLAGDGWPLIVSGTPVAGVTVVESLRRIGAITSGIVSGAGTGTETFEDYAESASTIVITVDGSGNRSAITYN